MFLVLTTIRLPADIKAKADTRGVNFVIFLDREGLLASTNAIFSSVKPLFECPPCPERLHIYDSQKSDNTINLQKSVSILSCLFGFHHFSKQCIFGAGFKCSHRDTVKLMNLHC